MINFVGGNSNLKEKYSTEEQKIGTWINGESLYRKVVLFTYPNKTPTDISLNIEHIKDIISYRTTVIFNNSSYRTIPYNYPPSPSADVGIIVDKTKLSITGSNELRGSSAWLIIEYTKTTD